MIGWRGRVGLLIPATNSVMEADFRKYLPDGVAAYASRMYKSTESSVEKSMEMLSYAESAASLLTQVGVDVIVFGCTSASVLKGQEGDQAVQHKITSATGVNTTTAARAIARAVSVMGVKNVAVITPYITPIHKKITELLQVEGYTIVSSANMGIAETVDMGKLEPAQIYRYVKANVGTGVEAVVISCTTIRSMEAIKLLERDLGIPVITSNQACLWEALSYLRIFDSVEGAGRLLLPEYRRHGTLSF